MAAPPNCNGANTTECILLTATAMLDKVERLLQEAEKTNSAFDWDPASFAVTFIIGLVALFFALLTIIQGLYAAGPGRLKCSRYPIGTWASLTKHRFHPSELRFRSVAYTPIISIDELLQHSWPDKSNWKRSRAELEFGFMYYSNYKEHISLPYHPKDPNEEYPATWLAILTTCGLDHPKWWSSKPQSPDYLPPELTATPAFSSVHDLVSLVALSSYRHRDEISVEIDFDGETRLPFMRSTYDGSTLLDLDFRRHPVLGLYGVVQTSRAAFQGPNFRGWVLGYPEHSRLEEDVAVTLLYAKGSIPTKPPLVNWSQKYVIDLDRKNNYESRMRDLEEACKADTVGCCTSEPACWMSYDTSLKPSQYFLYDEKLPSSLNPLAAEQVERALIFPWRASGLFEGLQSLLMLSRFWCLGEAINNIPGPRSSDSHSSTNSLQTHLVDSTSFGEFRANQDAFSFCFHFLRNFFTSSDGGKEMPSLKSDLRLINHLSEIDSIDDWLMGLDQRTVARRIFALHSSAVLCSYVAKVQPNQIAQNEVQSAPNDSGRLPRLSLTVMIPFIQATLEADLDDHLHRHLSAFGRENRTKLVDRLSQIKKLWEFDQDKGKFTYPSKDVQYWLDDLLIYRAILVAMALRLCAADNSEIIKDPAYRKLIPVL